MGLSMRALYMISSIGLGHAARARVVASELTRRGFDVEFIASGASGEYLEAWGFNVNKLSRELRSLGDVFYRNYLRRGSGGFSLGVVMEMGRVASRNRVIVEGSIDLDDYDLLIADESWEAMGSNRILSHKIPKAILIDFIAYRARGFSEIIPRILVNRFLTKAFRRFDLRLFIGFREGLRGDKYGFKYIGPIPPVLEKEMLDRDSARRMLGLGDGVYILFSLGGTGAGFETLTKILDAMRILRDWDIDAELVVAPGSRGFLEHLNRLGVKVVGDKYVYKLPTLVRAFDVVVSPSGLSTISLLAISGVPGVVFPLRGHFEQIENSLLVSRYFSNIYSLGEAWSPTDMARTIKRALGAGSAKGYRGVLGDPSMVADLLSQLSFRAL